MTPEPAPTAEQMREATTFILSLGLPIDFIPSDAQRKVCALLARVEAAERERDQWWTKAICAQVERDASREDAKVLADEVRKWRAAFSTWNANPNPNVFFHEPHRAIDDTNASGALERWGGK